MSKVHEEIMRECLNEIKFSIESYLIERRIDLEDLSMEELFKTICEFESEFLYEYFLYFKPHFYEYRWIIHIYQIMEIYFFLTKNYNVPIKTIDYISIFEDRPFINSVLELFAYVVGLVYKSYLDDVVDLPLIATLAFLDKNYEEFEKTSFNVKKDIVKLSIDAGLTLRELRRWFYYFTPNEIVWYLNKGYSLNKALKEIEDEEDNEYEEEE